MTYKIEWDNSPIVPDTETSFEGTAYDKQDMTIVDDSGLKLDIEADGGGDMEFFINGVLSTLDCTGGSGAGGKARVALTAGADANTPATNYIYVTDSGGTATLNVSASLPTGAFCWIGKIVVPDATTWATEGAYVFQRYTESFLNDSRGQASHEREKLRSLGALYESGCAHTLNITTNGGSADNVHLDVASGIVYQLHRQSFPALATGPYYFGNGTNIYDKVTDLNQVLELDDGSPITDKDRFSLVIWGAVNITTGESKLFVNVPLDVYNNDDQAIADRDNTAVYSIPAEMRSVAFLIARVVMDYRTGSSGTWTELGVFSLLGQPLGAQTGGSGAVASNQFVDSSFRIFDDGDSTKEIAFEASGITTSTTRTITVPDSDITLATFFTGTGTPEGSVTASPGALYTDQNGGAGTTLYVKESGTGNTGWIAK